MKFGLAEKWKSDKSIDDFVHKICKNVKDNTRKAKKAELAEAAKQIALEVEKSSDEEYQKRKVKPKRNKAELGNKEKGKKISRTATHLEKDGDVESPESNAIETAFNKTSKNRAKLMAGQGERRRDVDEQLLNYEVTGGKSAKKCAKLMAGSSGHRDNVDEEKKNRQVTDEKAVKKSTKKRAKLGSESTEHQYNGGEENEKCEETNEKAAKKAAKNVQS